MSDAADSSPIPYDYVAARPQAMESGRRLLRQLIVLSAPVMAEHVLHMLVGLTDTWLSNNLRDRANAPSAAAAVGTIAYFLWFIMLIVGSIAAGATAIIARAIGARHRSLANSVCGQSATAAVILGIAIGALLYFAAPAIVGITSLQGDQAKSFALIYLRMLAFSLPFSTFMFVANASLRGAGDTLTPALAMIVVDVINIACSFSLTYGWFGLPELGFRGIAAGTMIAYICGGLVQFFVLLGGRGGIRLHLHRLRPHWLTLKRILRIGVPSGLEGLLAWIANFGIVIIINGLDPTNAMPAAHFNAIRIEAFSYMGGFAIATAAATMVGQSLGMKDPSRAARSAYMSYAVGGAWMTLWGLFFIFFSHLPAQWISANAQIATLTAQCLFIAGFIQCFFAAAAVFGGALRGAGDTLSVMLINLASILGIRFVGVLIVGAYLGYGIVAIWGVLCFELFCRGVFVYLRFLHGGWKHIKV